MTGRGTGSLHYTHTRPRWWSLITNPPQTAYTLLDEPQGPQLTCPLWVPISRIDGFFFLFDWVHFHDDRYKTLDIV